MVKYEDPSEDPAIIEAIVNIKAAIRHLAPVYESTQNSLIWEAIMDAEQAVRFLEGKEEPT